jgi:transposase
MLCRVPGPGPGPIAYLVVAKSNDCLPPLRQLVIPAREGVNTPRFACVGANAVCWQLAYPS